MDIEIGVILTRNIDIDSVKYREIGTVRYRGNLGIALSRPISCPQSNYYR